MKRNMLVLIQIYASTCTIKIKKIKTSPGKCTLVSHPIVVGGGEKRYEQREFDSACHKQQCMEVPIFHPRVIGIHRQ